MSEWLTSGTQRRVAIPDALKVFVEFQYSAMVDLLKQLLTLEVGVLVLSVTFVDKIINKTEKRAYMLERKISVVSTWVLLTNAIIYGWSALQQMFIVGSAVRLGRDLGNHVDSAGTDFEVSAVLFVIALIVLVGTGSISMFLPQHD